MDISTVDPSDSGAFNAWYAAYVAATSHGRTDTPVWEKGELLALLLEDDDHRTWEREIAAAVDGDTVVGSAWIDWPMKDNLNRGEFILGVVPDARHRGVGAALYEHVATRLAARHRTVLATRVNQPVDNTRSSVPGSRFLLRRSGFTTVKVNVALGVLPMPVAPERLALHDEAAGEADGQGDTITTWVGACPERYGAQYARLKSLLSTQAPLGDSVYEPESWDVDIEGCATRKGFWRATPSVTALAVADDGAPSSAQRRPTRPSQVGHAFRDRWAARTSRTSPGHAPEGRQRSGTQRPGCLMSTGHNLERGIQRRDERRQRRFGVSNRRSHRGLGETGSGTVARHVIQLRRLRHDTSRTSPLPACPIVSPSSSNRAQTGTEPWDVLGGGATDIQYFSQCDRVHANRCTLRISSEEAVPARRDRAARGDLERSGILPAAR